MSSTNETGEFRIDVVNLYLAITNAPILYSSLEDLSKEITRVQETISGYGDIEEYTSVESLSTDGGLINICCDETDSVETKLSNTKNMLISYDADAMQFFKFTDAGYMKIDADGNIHYLEAPEFGQDFYIHDDYAGSTIAESGCGLCTACSAACYLTNAFYGPGYVSSLLTTSNTDSGIKKAAKVLGLDFYRGTASSLISAGISETVLNSNMTTEQAIESLINNGYSVGMLFVVNPVTRSEHFMCIPSSAGPDQYFVVDSCTNKGDKLTGVRTGVYSLDRIVAGDFYNQDTTIPTHSTLYVFKPTDDVGEASIAKNTISITSELASQIYDVNHNVVDGNIEKIDMPETYLSDAYNKIVDEYKGIKKT